MYNFTVKDDIMLVKSFSPILFLRFCIVAVTFIYLQETAVVFLLVVKMAASQHSLKPSMDLCHAFFNRFSELHYFTKKNGPRRIGYHGFLQIITVAFLLFLALARGL